MNTKINNILNRPVQHSEDLEPFGELDCHAIYVYYDGPLIYEVSNDKYRFLSYFIDSTESNAIYLYIPMTIEEQIDIELKKIDLRSFIDSKVFYFVAYADLKQQLLTPMTSKSLNYLLPDHKVFLEIQQELL
jgi:hypothetical protein